MKQRFLIFLISILLVQCKAFDKDITSPYANDKAAPKNQQQAREKDSLSFSSNRPKLVVGIVVDQMRYDYLTRFWDQFGNDGFKRLISEGYFMKNCHYNYAPTFTGPGHASIYTGTTPKNHGIIANDWYDKADAEMVYCVDDSTVRSVGTASEAGQRSPHRLISTTLGDENKLFTQFKGKNISVAIKDRSAILPGGHAADAAYWFQGKNEGRFISSSYYMETIPAWAQEFNDSGVADSYLKRWEPLKSIETYIESGADNTNFENGFGDKATPTFPYDLKKISEGKRGYDILKTVPFGNNLTIDFALAAMSGERLGKDNITDVLTISFSAPDYIGHNFGPNSKEIEDNYIRLDGQIARLIDSLDAKVGRGDYTLFLTGDHGAVNVPSFLQSKKIPAGYFDYGKLESALKNYLGKNFGTTEILQNISNGQIFLNKAAIASRNLNPVTIERELQGFLLHYPKVHEVYTRHAMMANDFESGIAWRIQNGFNQKRSGDLIVVLQPGYIGGNHRKGTTHGSVFEYDTHVPLIFYGKGIKKGHSAKESKITDIVPTMSALLNMDVPNASTGKVLTEVFK